MNNPPYAWVTGCSNIGWFLAVLLPLVLAVSDPTSCTQIKIKEAEMKNPSTSIRETKYENVREYNQLCFWYFPLFGEIFFSIKLKFSKAFLSQYLPPVYSIYLPLLLLIFPPFLSSILLLYLL